MTALTASAWIKLGIHGLPPTDGIGQNVWQDVKRKKNLRMVMLLRKKSHSDPTSLSRSYEKTKMVMEDGNFQDGFIKSEADFC